jgi:DNA-binding CsgD family transcriptional regulator
MATAGRRVQSVLRDAVSSSADAAGYPRALLKALNGAVPFDAACLASTDPAVLLPTSLTTVGYEVPDIYPTVLDIEFGDGDEPTRLDSLHHRPVPIRTLREATQGRVGASRLYADVLRPAGLGDEVRMLFRDRGGQCWGALTIARRPGREFSDAEVALLGAVLPDVADGWRTVLFRNATDIVDGSPDGPAIAVVNRGDELESVTPAALDYFDRLGWRPDPFLAPIPVAAAATWVRRSERGSVQLRARTRDGQLVVIRAGKYDGEPTPGRVVLTVQEAQLPHIVTLASLAHGLTRRETEVLAHLLAGQSRTEIARGPFLSDYTVQDHLRHISAKTGVRGRRALVAMLVRTEYLPRLGSRIGPDGWFADHRS